MRMNAGGRRKTSRGLLAGDGRRPPRGQPIPQLARKSVDRRDIFPIESCAGALDHPAIDLRREVIDVAVQVQIAGDLDVTLQVGDVDVAKRLDGLRDVALEAQ